MQAEVWKAILLRLPPERIDNLMLMTAQGTEINAQTVLRMEEEYLVLRGRLAGSNDGDRVFIVPYEHLDHIGRVAHTNTKIFLPTGDIDNSHPALGGHEIRTVNPAATTSR